MSHFFTFLFFFSATLILLQLPAISASTAFFSCSPQSFNTRSNYAVNLNTALLSLLNSTTFTGFYNTTAGDDVDRVYAAALCRGDLSSAQCQSCLVGAVDDVFRQCPNRRSAAVWYDTCRLRYSDTNFFQTLAGSPRDPYYYSVTKVGDINLFKAHFEKLFGELRGIALKDSKLFAAGKINYTSGGELYGLVQCSRDLDGPQCATCLDRPIQRVACCVNSVDLTFQGGSCYLRYSFDLFYNETAAAAVVATMRTSNSVGDGESAGFIKEKHKSTAFIVAAIVLGIAIVALLAGIAIRSMKRRKPRHIKLGGSRNLQLREGRGLTFHRLTSRKVSLFHNSRSPSDSPLDAQQLDIHTLKIATESFADTRRIGRGEFGLVYKGDIHGTEFVVKRLTARPQLGLKEIRKEFMSLKQLHHPNLVKLLAYHIEEDEKLLVYEYMLNTSLDRVLFDPKKRVLLDWGRRYRIIEGIGRGLLHLHEESGKNIVHLNLKASNVLLDKSMSPKLSDFCLTKLFIGNQSQGNNRRTSSAQGYMENTADGLRNAKTDVFGYGVLVLEIVTGQRNRDFLGPENSTNLLSYVWQYWKDEKVLQVLDWSLGELYKANEVIRCIHVGLLCVQDDITKRPMMSTVVEMLNNYSLTLPSPTVPSITRVRRPSNSSLPPRNGGPRNYDWNWKEFNHSVSPLSPQSPSDLVDIPLDSKGTNRR